MFTIYSIKIIQICMQKNIYIYIGGEESIMTPPPLPAWIRLKSDLIKIVYECQHDKDAIIHDVKFDIKGHIQIFFYKGLIFFVKGIEIYSDFYLIFDLCSYGQLLLLFSVRCNAIILISLIWMILILMRFRRKVLFDNEITLNVR